MRRQISDLELARDQAAERSATLEKCYSEIERANFELKSKLNRVSILEFLSTIHSVSFCQYWTSISAIFLCALLDESCNIILDKLKLIPDRVFYNDLKQNPSQTAADLHQRLDAETREILTPHAILVTFGYENASNKPKSIRERGNDAAHKRAQDGIQYDTNLAILQPDFTDIEKSSLEKIYCLVYGELPSLCAAAQLL